MIFFFISFPNIIILKTEFYTVKPPQNSHFGDQKKWPLWRGGRYEEVGV